MKEWAGAVCGLEAGWLYKLWVSGRERLVPFWC